MKCNFNGVVYRIYDNPFFRKEFVSLEWNAPKVGTIRQVPCGKIWVWKIEKRTIKNFLKKEVYWAIDSEMMINSYEKRVDEFFSRINKFII